MSIASEPLDSSQIMAAAVEVLNRGGYVEATPHRPRADNEQRVFEDPYGIVALTVFDTWTQLKDGWHIEQGALVDLMAENVRRAEPKAWEGYVVLLTPGLLLAEDRVLLNDLRNDTNRVRKIVATGDELTEISQVSESLLPLLPLNLETPSVPHGVSLLDRLPAVLSRGGVDPRLAELVVSSFNENESIIEALHNAKERL